MLIRVFSARERRVVQPRIAISSLETTVSQRELPRRRALLVRYVEFDDVLGVLDQLREGRFERLAFKRLRGPETLIAPRTGPFGFVIVSATQQSPFNRSPVSYAHPRSLIDQSSSNKASSSVIVCSVIRGRLY